MNTPSSGTATRPTRAVDPADAAEQAAGEVAHTHVGEAPGDLSPDPEQVGQVEPPEQAQQAEQVDSVSDESVAAPERPVELDGAQTPQVLASADVEFTDDENENRRRATAVAALLGLATVAAIAFAIGVFVGRSEPVAAPSAEPLTASGPIGPWQRYGHGSSSEKGFVAAASDPGGVLLLGDSVAARIRDDLAAALREQGRPMSWDHWNGRPTHGAADMLVALEAAGHQPATLVVVSGENDIFEPYLFATQVERIMRTAGPDRQVHWVMPVVSRAERAEPDLANSSRLSAALISASGRHPNLHLIDWPGRLAQAGSTGRLRLVPDGVHPSPIGSAEMVDLTMQSLAKAGVQKTAG